MKNPCRLFITLFLLLCIFGNTSYAQYGRRTTGAIYLKKNPTPLKGDFKFVNHASEVSLRKPDQILQRIPISEIDSILTEQNFLFLVKELNGKPTLLEASLIAPVSLLFDRKLQKYVYSNPKGIGVIPKEKFRGNLLVLFPDFSYTPKLRDPNYYALGYNEPYLKQLVTDYNKENYPEASPKSYQLPSKKTTFSISPYIGTSVSANYGKFLQREDVLDYQINLQPQVGLRMNLEGVGRFSVGLQTYWTKIYGHLPIDLGVKYQEVKERYQYISLAEFMVSGIGIDAQFRYALSDEKKSKNSLKIYIGPSLMLPQSSKNTVYNTAPVYSDSQLSYTPELVLSTTNNQPKPFVGLNAGLNSAWQISPTLDLNLDAGVRYLSMPSSYTDTPYGKYISYYSINSVQFNLGVFLSRH